MRSTVEFINPEGFLENPAFSHIAVTHGQGSTIYIGGQNAINKNREIIGPCDIKSQTSYVLDNIEEALSAAGASINDLVALKIYIVYGEDVGQGFAGAQEFLKKLKSPPVISGIIVAGLANPEYLVEIEAIAFLKAPDSL